MAKETFEDHENYKAWVRFKDAQSDEKQWMHQRLGWMMVAQAAILAIVGLETNESSNATFKTILQFLPVAGLIVSSVGFLGTLAAAQMHWRWTSNLNQIVAELDSSAVLTFGSKPHWPARTSSIIPPTLGFLFVGLWGYLIATSLSKNTPLCGHEMYIYGVIMAIVAAVSLIIMFKGQKENLWEAALRYDWQPDCSLMKELKKIDGEVLDLDSYAACIFDFDGVIASQYEEHIYQLEGTRTEQKKLSEIAQRLGIRCTEMPIKYQRHLLYQAAAHINERGAAPAIKAGPAIEEFTTSCKTKPTFILSARSGWFAVERARCFVANELKNQTLYPLETFQVGRTTKSQQIKVIMDEHEGNVIFFEDSLEHIRKVYSELAKEYRSRLTFCHVQNPPGKNSETLEQEVDAVFAQFLERPAKFSNQGSDS